MIDIEVDVALTLPGLISAEVQDHLILHDPSKHRTHVLNPSAALVWASIAGHNSVRATIERVAASLDGGTDADTLSREVVEALTRFVDEGVVHLTRDGTGAPLPGWPTPAEQAGVADGIADQGRHSSERSQPEWPPLPSGSKWCLGPGPRQLLGTTVELLTTDPDLAEAFSELLGSFPRATESDHHVAVVTSDELDVDGYRSTVTTDGQVVARTVETDLALRHALSESNRLAIDNTPDRLVLHAGAVETAGHVVVIIGESGHGKSTLVAALVRSGMAYVTDEAVALDPVSGRVDVYPKWIDLDEPSRALLGLEQVDVSAAAAGLKYPLPPNRLGPVSAGGRAGLLVLLGSPDTATTSSSEPTGGYPMAVRRLLAILDNTFSTTTALPGALEHLAELSASMPVLDLDRADLATMVATVTGALRAGMRGGDGG